MEKIINFFKSDAAQNNVLLAVISVVILVFGGDPATLGVAGLVMFIWEIAKGERKARWTGNIVVYILSTLVGFFPWLADMVTALQPIVDYIFSGGEITLGALFPFLIPLFNEIIFLFQKKPWKEEEEQTA